MHSGASPRPDQPIRSRLAVVMMVAVTSASFIHATALRPACCAEPPEGVWFRYSLKRLPVPNQPCPCCGANTPRLVESVSQIATVNYYRCALCGHVWTVAKDGSERIHHVTPLPATRDERR